jgi:hypothetical protein
MNFAMMLALLTTGQTPEMKALDFKLVGVKPAIVAMAPRESLFTEERPPVVAAPVPDYKPKTRIVSAAPLDQGPIDIHVRIQQEALAQEAPPAVVQDAPQYFQEAGGQPYRVIRRYIVSSPSQTYAADPSSACVNGSCPTSGARVRRLAPTQVYTSSQSFETAPVMQSFESYGSSMGSCTTGSCSAPSSMGVQSFGSAPMVRMRSTTPPLGSGLRGFGSRLFGGAGGSSCAGGSCR